MGQNFKKLECPTKTYFTSVAQDILQTDDVWVALIGKLMLNDDQQDMQVNYLGIWMSR